MMITDAGRRRLPRRKSAGWLRSLESGILSNQAAGMTFPRGSDSRLAGRAGCPGRPFPSIDCPAAPGADGGRVIRARMSQHQQYRTSHFFGSINALRREARRSAIVASRMALRRHVASAAQNDAPSLRAISWRGIGRPARTSGKSSRYGSALCSRLVSEPEPRTEGMVVATK
jgi:hypothetical protein